MPLYVYKCPRHGMFDMMQSMSSKRIADCPKCGDYSIPIITSCRHRVATPIRWVTEDGTILAEKADSGIRPPMGQPYPVLS